MITGQRATHYPAGAAVSGIRRNFSSTGEWMQTTSITVSSPRVVRAAEQLMRISGPETSIGEIAERVGVSLRTLEVAFRAHRHETPTQRRRGIRLEAARAELLDPRETTTVTSVALDHGSFH